MKDLQAMSYIRCLFVFFILLLSACSDDEVDPTIVSSEYSLDGTQYEITSKLFWRRAENSQDEDQLRLIQEVSPDGQSDMIILIPVLGEGSLVGSYIFSKTGDIRTYNIVYVRDINGEENFEWITNGDQGAPLEIVRAGTENGEPVYTITLEDFDLNYGFYDFLGNKWVSNGVKKFSFQYQGIIE